MRLPAVALAVAFAGGILLGRQISLSSPYFTQRILPLAFVAVFFLLCFGVFLALRNRLWPAAGFSLLCWAILGFVAMGLASRPLPPQHILRRLAAGQLELKTPFRWYGHCAAIRRVCLGDMESSLSFRVWRPLTGWCP